MWSPKNVLLIGLGVVGLFWVLSKSGTTVPWFPVHFNSNSPPAVPSPVGGGVSGVV